jgi:hypothetical protein
MASKISGIISVIIGLIMVIGGGTGNLVLRGTNRSDLLMILGIIVIAYGAYVTYKATK